MDPRAHRGIRVQRFWLLLVILCAIASGPAWAVRAPDEPSPQQPAQAPASNDPTAVRREPRSRARDVERPPQAFTVQVRPRAVTLPGAPRSEPEVIEALRVAFRRHPEWLGGLRPESLVVTHVSTVPGVAGASGTVYAQFAQQLHGLAIDGTSVHCSVKLLPHASVLMAVHATLYPTLRLTLRPRLDHARVEALAKGAARLADRLTRATQERQSIRYLHGRWRRVHEARFAETHEKAVVDVETGETWTQDDRVYDTIQGRVRGRGILFDPIATGANLVTLDLGDLKVTSTIGNVSYTGSTGLFEFPTETNPTIVTAKLLGHVATVTSVTSPNLSLSQAATPGVPVQLLFNPVNAEELVTAQVNGYYHTGRIHDWTAARLAGPLPEMDIQLPVKVNLNDTCNAFYDYASINFYKAGNSCVNTAYDTVVYHEYGHFVDDKAGGITNGGLSEGWGDVLAALATNQPLIGENFFGAGTMIRTADNTYQYPPNPENEEVHALGQAWAGFAWHLRQNLIASQGQAAGIALTEQLVIPVLLANSSDIPAAAFEVLLRDDDDGNWANGTPHETEIRSAAQQHSIPLPENDGTPPSAVNDLAAAASGLGRITLSWTATGDDGAVGTAASYDIRYATTAILNDADFLVAAQAGGEPTPGPSGTPEQFTVLGLSPNTTYFFALKALDNVGNASVVSNSPSATTAEGSSVLDEAFESGAPGWTPSGLWHVSTTRANSPTHSAAYNDGVDYDTGVANSGSLVSPPINLAAATEAVLSFSHWYETESYSSPYDIRRVEVSSDGGATWTMLKQWDSRDPNQLFFASFALDLTPYAGQTIHLRFTFDSVDAAYNSFEGWYVDDVKVLAQIPSSCPLTTATYDSTLMAPACLSSGCGCDTGTTVVSRDSIATQQEPHQPNTLGGSCADGTVGTYHADESVDRVSVRTADGTAFQPGQAVEVEVSGWCWGTGDAVDVYYASNAASPSWSAVATGLVCGGSQRTETFQVAFTLAPVSGLHAVRAQMRYGGSASSCTTGGYDDRDDLVFQVGSSNQAPTLDPIGNRAGQENAPLTFTISASDPDDAALTYTADPLPTGAAFDATTRTFTWTPTFDQAGDYPITFTVSDGALSDSETITITVANVNRPPVFSPVPNQAGSESQLLTFTVSASDPDGDPVTYTAGPLPSGAAFDAATRTFSWVPTYAQSGGYGVTFTASDGSASDSETPTLTIANVSNLVQNPDFELGKQNWSLPSGGSVDATVGWSGSASAKLTKKGLLTSTPRVGVTAGTTYVVSGWLKLQNVAASSSNGARLGIQWYKASGSSISSKYVVKKLKGTKDWTHYTKTFTAPSGAATARLRLEVTGSGTTGTAWFDGVAITP